MFQGGITAVLGPSSGGKSVLMKVLTGRLPTVQCTGEVSAPRHYVESIVHSSGEQSHSPFVTLRQEISYNVSYN